jgi:hypothetical protein
MSKISRKRERVMTCDCSHSTDYRRYSRPPEVMFTAYSDHYMTYGRAVRGFRRLPLLKCS